MRPASPYAVSKVFQDICAQNYSKNFGLKIIITRMFTYLNPRRLNLFASHWANQIVKIEKGEEKNFKTWKFKFYKNNNRYRGCDEVILDCRYKGKSW